MWKFRTNNFKYISSKTAIEKYCREYKGENWVLSNRTDILFANNPTLWAKVDASWQQKTRLSVILIIFIFVGLFNYIQIQNS